MPARHAPARFSMAIVLGMALIAGLAGCGGDDLSSSTSSTAGADPNSDSTSVTTAAASDASGSGSTSESTTGLDPVSTTAVDPPAEASTITTTKLPGPGRVLFSCITTNDKQIELTEYGSIIRYVFGPPDQPEIVLDVDRALATTYQWEGIGRNESYSVDVPNPTATDHEYIYSVFWNYDKLTEGPEAYTAGVVVSIDGEAGVTVRCADPGSAMMNLIGVDLAPSV